jgi:hypothetical protein
MKLKIILLVITLFTASCVKLKTFSELNVVSKDILSQGLELYKLETASWMSSDSVMASYHSLIEKNTKNEGTYNYPGYVTYRKDSVIYSIYYSSIHSKKGLRFTYIDLDSKNVILKSINKDSDISDFERNN